MIKVKSHSLINVVIKLKFRAMSIEDVEETFNKYYIEEITSKARSNFKLGLLPSIIKE